MFFPLAFTTTPSKSFLYTYKTFTCFNSIQVHRLWKNLCLVPFRSCAGKRTSQDYWIRFSNYTTRKLSKDNSKAFLKSCCFVLHPLPLKPSRISTVIEVCERPKTLPPLQIPVASLFPLYRCCFCWSKLCRRKALMKVSELVKIPPGDRYTSRTSNEDSRVGNSKNLVDSFFLLYRCYFVLTKTV